MPEIKLIKKCSKCGAEKDLTNFCKNRALKDGYSSWCKICHREHAKKKYAENPEKQNEKTKNWIENHRDQHKNYLKKSYSKRKQNKTELPAEMENRENDIQDFT